MAHAQRFFTGPYADTWIPQWLLISLGLAIPPLELIGGTLLVIGLGVRPVLIVFGVLLVTVTYGHLLKDPRFDLAHVIFLRLILLAIALVMPAQEDTLSVDAWLAKPGRRQPRMDAD